jgi:hypothetical protein
VLVLPEVLSDSDSVCDGGIEMNEWVVFVFVVLVVCVVSLD